MVTPNWCDVYMHFFKLKFVSVGRILFYSLQGIKHVQLLIFWHRNAHGIWKVQPKHFLLTCVFFSPCVMVVKHIYLGSFFFFGNVSKILVFHCIINDIILLWISKSCKPIKCNLTQIFREKVEKSETQIWPFPKY